MMPTYLFGILFFWAPSQAGVSLLEPASRYSLLLLLCIYTFVAPALVIYGMYRLRVIQSVRAENLHERRWPYLITALIYVTATFFFGWQFSPISEIAPQIGMLLASFTVAISVLAIISLWWQISAHMTGIAGVMGLLFMLLVRGNEPLLLIPAIASVLVTGWVAASRLQLNAHTTLQVAAGLLLGLGVSAATGCLFF